MWMLKALDAPDLPRGRRVGERFAVEWVPVDAPEQGIGSAGEPDGRWLFVNLYTPGFTVAITGPWRKGLV